MIRQMSFDQQGKNDVQINMNFIMQIALFHLILRLHLCVDNEFSTQKTVNKVALKRFQYFKKLLEQQFYESHHIYQYAQDMGCSEKSLNRAVFEITGVSAKNYLSQRITLQAKRLLVHTNQSIAAIGFELGFDEPTNFGKFFKREAGMLPMAFRQLYLRHD